jgi:hypothetical protein
LSGISVFLYAQPRNKCKPTSARNVRNNGRIVWKNIEVMEAGQRVAYMTAGQLQRDEGMGKLVFAGPGLQERVEASIFKAGSVTVDLGGKLFEIWKAGGSVGTGIKPVAKTSLAVREPGAWIGNRRCARVSCSRLVSVEEDVLKIKR